MISGQLLKMGLDEDKSHQGFSLSAEKLID